MLAVVAAWLTLAAVAARLTTLAARLLLTAVASRLTTLAARLALAAVASRRRLAAVASRPRLTTMGSRLVLSALGTWGVLPALGSWLMLSALGTWLVLPALGSRVPSVASLWAAAGRWLRSDDLHPPRSCCAAEQDAGDQRERIDPTGAVVLAGVALFGLLLGGFADRRDLVPDGDGPLHSQ